MVSFQNYVQHPNLPTKLNIGPYKKFIKKSYCQKLNCASCNKFLLNCPLPKLCTAFPPHTKMAAITENKKGIGMQKYGIRWCSTKVMSDISAHQPKQLPKQNLVQLRTFWQNLLECLSSKINFCQTWKIGPLG